MCVSVCVKVLKEELKLKVNELDVILKTNKHKQHKKIHCTVYLNAYCAWRKSAKCENL